MAIIDKITKVQGIVIWDIANKKYVRFDKLHKLYANYDFLISPLAGYKIHIVK